MAWALPARLTMRLGGASASLPCVLEGRGHNASGVSALVKSQPSEAQAMASILDDSNTKKTTSTFLKGQPKDWQRTPA